MRYALDIDNARENIMVNPFVWLVDKLADLVGPIELEDLTEDES